MVNMNIDLVENLHFGTIFQRTRIKKNKIST